MFRSRSLGQREGANLLPFLVDEQVNPMINLAKTFFFFWGIMETIESKGDKGIELPTSMNWTFIKGYYHKVDHTDNDLNQPATTTIYVSPNLLNCLCRRCDVQLVTYGDSDATTMCNANNEGSRCPNNLKVGLRT